MESKISRGWVKVKIKNRQPTKACSITTARPWDVHLMLSFLQVNLLKPYLHLVFLKIMQVISILPQPDRLEGLHLVDCNSQLMAGKAYENNIKQECSFPDYIMGERSSLTRINYLNIRSSHSAHSKT